MADHVLPLTVLTSLILSPDERQPMVAEESECRPRKQRPKSQLIYHVCNGQELGSLSTTHLRRKLSQIQSRHPRMQRVDRLSRLQSCSGFGDPVERRPSWLSPQLIHAPQCTL